MKRNAQWRWEWLTGGLLTALFAAGGLAVSPICALLMLLCGGGIMLAHLCFTRRRYRAIAALSQSVDRVLHGQDEVLIDQSEEGELSILRSEIQKMTVRLRDNAQLLAEDKRHLTRLLEDILHQLRTPLTAMRLELAMLGGEGLGDQRRIELSRELEGQLERINWLVEALLKMSQLDAGTVALRRDNVSVAQLCRRAVAPLAIPMELRQQELAIHVKEEHFTGDLAWTAEALGNILKNCMEHTPAGGRISVAAEETALYTQITVCDSGPGFDPEELPHLFERFYRGKSAEGTGIGIGLALSRKVIVWQGGTVTAGNASGGGARFVIRFYKSVV